MLPLGFEAALASSLHTLSHATWRYTFCCTSVLAAPSFHALLSGQATSQEPDSAALLENRVRVESFRFVVVVANGTYQWGRQEMDGIQREAVATSLPAAQEIFRLSNVNWSGRGGVG